MAGDTAGGVYAFHGKSGDQRWSHASAHDGSVLAVAVAADGAVFATAAQDGLVCIWNVQDDANRLDVRVGDGWVDNLAWSHDGQMLAASCGRRVHVYDPKGKQLWQSDEHPSTVSSVAWAGDGDLATACYGRVTFFEAHSGVVKQTLEWKGSLVSMALSPDGKIVACGSQDNSVHFWLRASAQDYMMGGYSGKPSALAFDSSGDFLATGGGHAVTVWCFAGGGPEGTRPGSLELHVRPVSAIAFARRGSRLASGGRDGAVIVWALKADGDGDPIGVALLSDNVSKVLWRPDGRALAALDAQGSVTVWRVR